MAARRKCGQFVQTPVLHESSLWIVPLGHDDGGDLATIVGLIQLGFTPVAEEKRFVLAGAGREVNDTPEPRIVEPLRHEAGKVEVRARGFAAPRKEIAELWIARQKLRFEL